MACSSDPSSSSLILEAVNATLNDPSFTTGSEVAADALEAAKTLKDWCVCGKITGQQELSFHGGCHFCAKQELFLHQHSTST